MSRPQPEAAPRDIARDLGWPMGRGDTAFSYGDLADEAFRRYWEARPEQKPADLARWRHRRAQDTTPAVVWLRRGGEAA